MNSFGVKYIALLCFHNQCVHLIWQVFLDLIATLTSIVVQQGLNLKCFLKEYGIYILSKGIQFPRLNINHNCSFDVFLGFSVAIGKKGYNLCTLSNISSKIADNAKFEYDSFQSVTIKKQSEVFLTYDPRKERLDDFLGKYVRPEFENFQHICKAVFFFSHGQSLVECGFLVNKLTIDGNMQEKAIVSQRLICDCLKQEECPVSEFTISGDLHKSSFLASQRYKSDQEKINSDKNNADISLKRSANLQGIEIVKSKKAKLQESVDLKKTS